MALARCLKCGQPQFDQKLLVRCGAGELFAVAVVELVILVLIFVGHDHGAGAHAVTVSVGAAGGFAGSGAGARRFAGVGAIGVDLFWAGEGERPMRAGVGL